MDEKDKQTLLKVKSLLNDLRYIIKEEDLKVVDEYHSLLRKEIADFKKEVADEVQ